MGESIGYIENIEQCIYCKDYIGDIPNDTQVFFQDLFIAPSTIIVRKQYNSFEVKNGTNGIFVNGTFLRNVELYKKGDKFDMLRFSFVTFKLQDIQLCPKEDITFDEWSGTSRMRVKTNNLYSTIYMNNYDMTTYTILHDDPCYICINTDNNLPSVCIPLVLPLTSDEKYDVLMKYCSDLSSDLCRVISSF